MSFTMKSHHRHPCLLLCKCEKTTMSNYVTCRHSIVVLQDWKNDNE
jgi:hypothetical protein